MGWWDGGMSVRYTIPLTHRPTIPQATMAMSLDSYLNDHLSGSVAGLELMNRLAEAHQGTPLGVLMRRFHVEVGEEQELLKSLIEACGSSEKPLAKAAAWLGERISRLKLDSGSEDNLCLFESLETLSLGFWGRRALWTALRHVRPEGAAFARLDYDGLIARCDEHLKALEAVRLDVARDALAAQSATQVRSSEGDA